MSSERIKVGKNELGPGGRFYCESVSFDRGGETRQVVGGIVEDVRGGGFYGRTLLLPNAVVKTAEPDSWHLFWRNLNWGLKPFPSQSSELAAQLDHLATKIIHRIVPVATDGEVVTPDSLGYADLGRLGYGQVLERMRGRGVRFDVANGENVKFARTRRTVWNLSSVLGIEHGSQVHPDNPFGKQNMWINEGGQMIWLDVLPAIKHTGFVLPAFYFRFHNDVKRNIMSEEKTFNKLNTSRLRDFVDGRLDQIAGDDKRELTFYLDSYDGVSEKFKQEMKRGARDLVIEDAYKRGIVSQSEALSLNESNFAYYTFLAERIVSPAARAFWEAVEISDEFKRDVRRFLIDPSFRKEKIVEHTTLAGLKRAFDLGLVDGPDWQEAKELLVEPLMSGVEKRRLAATYFGMQLWYTAYGWANNLVAWSTIGSTPFSENPGARLALGLFFELALPSIVRGVSTRLVNALTEDDLSTMVKVAVLPKLGGYLAVPADLAKRYGDKSEQIWHYTKRGLVASFSKVLQPWGGWNSDLEERLWGVLKGDRW